MRHLKFTFLTHRQRGGPEALYCMMKNMSLKKSNRGCKFVTAGFPENRSLMWDQVQEKEAEAVMPLPTDDDEDNDEYLENEDADFFTNQNSKDIVEIANRSGKWKARML